MTPRPRTAPALVVLALGVAGLGCSSALESSSRRARHVEGIDLGACLAASDAGAPPPSSCAGFLIEELRAARDTCRDAGGRLVPSDSADVWAIDVDGDGAEELTFELGGNVQCEGAWSVFSCGSLGCPITLYRQGAGREGAWRPIAAIRADTPASIEVLERTSNGAYRDLRVSCAGPEPCEVHAYYTWAGAVYEPSHVVVRGFRVNVAGSVHGLHALLRDTDLLAEPDAGGRVIARHPAGTEVAIAGTADGADYYYVSPCNACESGFVPRAAVAPTRS